MDPETIMQGQSIRRGSVLTDICCLIFVIGFIIFDFVVYKQVDMFSWFLLIMVVGLVSYNIYSRYNWKQRVRNHILRYKDGRVPIVTVMKDLNLPFLDVMYFVEEMKKKKLPVEVNERTGEILVGDVPLHRSYWVNNKKNAEEKQKHFAPTGKPKMITCPHCNALMSENYQFCDKCGQRIQPLQTEESNT
ncbi:MAG: hypothetical protein ACTSRW_04985 [Candidatus Helarchaeota archaeon]